MEQNRSNFLALNYAGFVILLACILGGGTKQGLWTDHIIEIAMIPILVMGFANLFNNRLSATARIFVLLLVGFLALQFLPFSPPNVLPEPIAVTPIKFWSISPSGSIAAVHYVIALTGFALYVSCLSQEQQIWLIKFVFLGLIINIAIGTVQLSYSGATRVSGVLPYNITSATFANENHFSAFVFMTIPLFGWRYLAQEKKPFTFIVITCLLVGFLFAVGSRAGMAISIAISVFSLIWFLIGNNRVKLKLGILIAASVGLILIFTNGGLEQALEGDLRLVFFKNTFQAFKDHWLTGTGLGSFLIVYPTYEQSSDIVRVYANHAHNDYLEVMMEGGIIAGILIVSFLALLLRNLFNTPLTQACALSLMVILLHSIVDYPLRTFGVAIIFVLFSAIILSRKNDEMANSKHKKDQHI